MDWSQDWLYGAKMCPLSSREFQKRFDCHWQDKTEIRACSLTTFDRFLHILFLYLSLSHPLAVFCLSVTVHVWSFIPVCLYLCLLSVHFLWLCISLDLTLHCFFMFVASSGLYSFNTHLLCLFIDTTSFTFTHIFIILVFRVLFDIVSVFSPSLLCRLCIWIVSIIAVFGVDHLIEFLTRTNSCFLFS